MLVYDAILDGNFNNDNDAKEYVRGIAWNEMGTREQYIKYYVHVGTIHGVRIYRDYSAGYYFFTDETGGK
jgi:hypothetical protein